MDMHGATWLALHGFGHESGIDTVFVSRFSHRTLKSKHLVCQAQRITVDEINLHLGCTVFVNDGIDIQLLRSSIAVHISDKIIELCHRIDTEGQTRGLSAP